MSTATAVFSLSAPRSSFQLKKLSELVIRNGAMLSKSAFPNSSVDMNILQESMTVITCFEMPLGFGWWWHWSFVDIFASVPVYCLSLLFLLILIELSLWKVLPSLIRCCHCVENQSLYNIMIFRKRVLQCSWICPNLLILFPQPVSDLLTFTVHSYSPKWYD